MLLEHVEKRIVVIRVLGSVVSDPIRMNPWMHVRPWSDALKPRVGELLMGKRFAKYSLLLSSWTVAIMVK